MDDFGPGTTASGRDWALSQDRRLRLFAVFILYVAQGVPIGLFWFAIPAWMAANGAAATDVAYVLGFTALPWSLKLVNGFLMDRYTVLAMGRRRVWLIGAQLAMIGLLIACAVLAPGAGDVAVLAAIGFAVNTATTFQDVAIDGMAVDIMQEDERARASGMMFGGQSIGMALATAASGVAITRYGPSVAYLLAALFIALVTLFVITVRERPGERRLPWSRGAASPVNLTVQAHRWWPILRHTFRAILRPTSLFYLAVLLIKGAQYGVLTGATPLIATGAGGWGADRITAISGAAQLVAGVAGMTVGGLLGDRLGAKWASILFMGCWLALNATMFAAQPSWADSRFLTVFIITWFSLDTLITVATLPIAMGLCHRTVAATQFTLYMALNNVGVTLGAGLLGYADRLGGIGTVFAILAVANLVAIAILLVVRFTAPQERVASAAPLPLGERLGSAIG